MLSCKEVTDRASGLLEGELALRDSVGVRLHLLMCNRCRRFVRQLRVLVASLRARELAEPLTSEFVDRVVAKAIASHQIEPRPPRESAS